LLCSKSLKIHNGKSYKVKEYYRKKQTKKEVIINKQDANADKVFIYLLIQSILFLLFRFLKYIYPSACFLQNIGNKRQEKE
jgi:hypothetical protein